MKSPRSVQRGILLLESLIAILLISFGILGLVGLWANSVRDVSQAKYRNDATYLANELIGLMWLSRPITTGYTPPTSWTTRVAATLPGGLATVTPIIDPVSPALVQVTVRVTWTQPGAASSHFVETTARINGAGPI